MHHLLESSLVPKLTVDCRGIDHTTHHTYITHSRTSHTTHNTSNQAIKTTRTAVGVHYFLPSPLYITSHITHNKQSRHQRTCGRCALHVPLFTITITMTMTMTIIHYNIYNLPKIIFDCTLLVYNISVGGLL